MPMLALVALSSALAGPIFTTIGPETYLDASGNWPRAFPTADGWHLLHANTNDYQYSFLRDDLTRDPALDRDLTGVTGLRDHSMSECPDGTYFEVATADGVSEADSAYTYTYDADFNLLDHGTIIENASEGILADVPGVCGETFRGAGWYVPELSLPLRYASIDSSLNVTGTYDIEKSGSAMGGTFIEAGDQLLFVSAPGKDDDSLTVTTLTTSLASLDVLELHIMPEGWRAYWSQGVVHVGDCYIVAHMAQDTAFEWATSTGDVWVAAFDESWTLLDQAQLSYNVAPDGGGQPGIARKDDTLLVTYARDLQNYGYAITMDLDACNYVEEPVDTGGGDTGGGDTAVDSGGDTGPDSGTDTGTDSGTDSVDTGADSDTGTDTSADDSGDESGNLDTGGDDKSGCGCASGGDGTWAAALVAGLLTLRRRRYDP